MLPLKQHISIILLILGVLFRCPEVEAGLPQGLMKDLGYGIACGYVCTAVVFSTLTHCYHTSVKRAEERRIRYEGIIHETKKVLESIESTHRLFNTPDSKHTDIVEYLKEAAQKDLYITEFKTLVESNARQVSHAIESLRTIPQQLNAHEREKTIATQREQYLNLLTRYKQSLLLQHVAIVDFVAKRTQPFVELTRIHTQVDRSYLPLAKYINTTNFAHRIKEQYAGTSAGIKRLINVPYSAAIESINTVIEKLSQYAIDLDQQPYQDSHTTAMLAKNSQYIADLHNIRNAIVQLPEFTKENEQLPAMLHQVTEAEKAEAEKLRQKAATLHEMQAIENNRKERESLIANYSKAKSDLTHTQEKVRGLEQEIRRLKAEQTLTTVINKVGETVDTMKHEDALKIAQQEKRALEAKVKRLETEMREQQTVIQASVSQGSTTIAEKSRQIAALQTRVGTLEDQISQYKQHAYLSRNNIRALTAICIDVNTVKNELNTLAQKEGTPSGDIMTSANKVEAIQKQLANLIKNIHPSEETTPTPSAPPAYATVQN